MRLYVVIGALPVSRRQQIGERSESGRVPIRQEKQLVGVVAQVMLCITGFTQSHAGRMTVMTTACGGACRRNMPA